MNTCGCVCLFAIGFCRATPDPDESLFDSGRRPATPLDQSWQIEVMYVGPRGSLVGMAAFDVAFTANKSREFNE